MELTVEMLNVIISWAEHCEEIGDEWTIFEAGTLEALKLERDRIQAGN